MFGILYTPPLYAKGMTKNASDLILRDRLQFTLTAGLAPDGGNQTTVYGRFDLSGYVNTLERKGLSIKEVNFMLRQPTGATANVTGNMRYLGDNQNFDATPSVSDLKVYATTRAYENAADVGIASPDVLCIETFQSITGPEIITDPANDPTIGDVRSSSTWWSLIHNKYGTNDLHPAGFPVVTDMLVGIACANWTALGDTTLELDVMIIASPITITQKQLTEMLVQGQDQ